MYKWISLLLAIVFNVMVIIIFFQNFKLSLTAYFFVSQLKIPIFLIYVSTLSFLGGLFTMGAISGFITSNKGYDEELDI